MENLIDVVPTSPVLRRRQSEDTQSQRRVQEHSILKLMSGAESIHAATVRKWTFKTPDELPVTPRWRIVKVAEIMKLAWALVGVGQCFPLIMCRTLPLTFFSLPFPSWCLLGDWSLHIRFSSSYFFRRHLFLLTVVYLLYFFFAVDCLFIFRMLTIRSPAGVALLALLGAFIGDVAAVPQNRKGGNRKGGQTQQAQTLQQQAAQIPQGVSQATDGSTILDMTATVKYVVIPLLPLGRVDFQALSFQLTKMPSPAASTSASKSQLLQTNSSPTLASRARHRRLAPRVPTASTSCCMAMAASRSSTCPTRLCSKVSWVLPSWLPVSNFFGA